MFISVALSGHAGQYLPKLRMISGINRLAPFNKGHYYSQNNFINIRSAKIYLSIL